MSKRFRHLVFKIGPYLPRKDFSNVCEFTPASWVSNYWDFQKTGSVLHERGHPRSRSGRRADGMYERNSAESRESQRNRGLCRICTFPSPWLLRRMGEHRERGGGEWGRQHNFSFGRAQELHHLKGAAPYVFCLFFAAKSGAI